MIVLLAATGAAADYEMFVSFMMTPLMAMEILAAEFLLAKTFKRRMYFYIRFFGSGLACVLMTMLIEITFSLATGQSFIYGGTDNVVNTVFKIFYYIVILGMTYLCLFFSYNESPTFLATACAVGYAVQFLAANAAQLLQIASDYMQQPWNYVYDAVIYWITRVAVYIPLYFLLIRKHFKTALHSGNNSAKLLLLIITVVVCVFLSRLSVDDTGRTLLAMIVQPLYSIMCGVLIIFVHFGLTANDSMHDTVAQISELLHQEREQYRLTKESIEIINEKCHDLKHQVARLREGGSEKQIAEIENAIMIYDTNFKTGNDTLDVLLTQKKLQCEANKITFTCMVNGEAISFMDEMDIFSLFGNAISNAIENVSKIADPKRRQVSLKVRRMGNVCAIHVENYYTGKINIQDGLPVTDKDENYHGFGMRSMKRIVESYGGAITVTVTDELFILDMAMPCSGKKDGILPIRRFD